MMRRNGFMWVAALAFGSLVFAYVLQYGFGQQPCDLCILQRLCVYAVLAAALLAHFSRFTQWSRLLGLGFAGLGLYFAGRQIYLQHLPEDLKPGCGPGFYFMLDNESWVEAIASAIHGSGDCAKIGWTFLGQSLAVWTAVLFVVLIGMLIFSRNKT